MMNRELIAFLLLAVSAFVSIPARATEPTPAEILDSMRNAYSNLTSYSDSGMVETTVSMGGQNHVLKKPFVIIFKKPDLIRIEWTSSFGGLQDPHVMWSSKNGTFTHNQLLNQTRKDESLELAIRSWTGVSGGSVRTVPCLLISMTKDPQFSDLADLKSDGTETIDSTVCRKISGTRRGQPIVLWIGDKDFFLRKITASTPFGDIVEVHENIKSNAVINEASASFSPPKDAEQVKRFSYKKLKGNAQQKNVPFSQPPSQVKKR